MLGVVENQAVCLETVCFDRPFRYPLLDEEVINLGPLVSLKLDNHACLLITSDGAVAGEFLIVLYVRSCTENEVIGRDDQITNLLESF